MKKLHEIRHQRFFCEELRKQIVGQIERGDLTVAHAMREYNIKSRQTIYTWLYRYSLTLKKGTRTVMEKDSHGKTTQELKSRIKELEAALGRKSLEADLFRIIIEKASDEFRVDLKKSFGGQGSGPYQK